MTNILKKLWRFLRKDIYNKKEIKDEEIPHNLNSESYNIKIKEVKIKKIDIKN